MSVVVLLTGWASHPVETHRPALPEECRSLVGKTARREGRTISSIVNFTPKEARFHCANLRYV